MEAAVCMHVQICILYGNPLYTESEEAQL